MTNSVVRLTIGTLMLAGATAGAVGAPQPSDLAERLAACLTNPVYAVTLGAALGLLALVLVRISAAKPSYAGRHRE
jgi:hypothetical protein